MINLVKEILECDGEVTDTEGSKTIGNTAIE
jgi:hypothetical protein